MIFQVFNLTPMRHTQLWSHLISWTVCELLGNTLKMLLKIYLKITYIYAWNSFLISVSPFTGPQVSRTMQMWIFISFVSFPHGNVVGRCKFGVIISTVNVLCYIPVRFALQSNYFAPQVFFLSSEIFVK